MKKYVIGMSILIVILCLTSCVGIGDGEIVGSTPPAGDKSDVGFISSGRIPTLNDGDELKAFVSRIYAEGEEGSMPLANGGTWLLYEYFTEAEYDSAESKDRTDNEKDCLSVTFERSLYGKDEFSPICSFRVEDDDFVVYTYLANGSNISFYGFLPGAYKKLNEAFEDAMAYYENKAGLSFDSLLISSESSVIFTPSAFSEIDCTAVKFICDTADGKKLWRVKVDSVTEAEIVDAFKKLEKRADVLSVQYDYIN